MTVCEIIAIILTALAGSLLFTSLTLFGVFITKTIKEKPAEGFLGGFVITFILSVVFIFIGSLFILLVS